MFAVEAIKLGASDYIYKPFKIDDPTKLNFHLRVLKSANIVEQDSNKVYMLTQKGMRLLETRGKF